MTFPAPLAQALTDHPLSDLPTVTGPHQPITGTSICFFLLALLWASALLISFTGWGRLTAKLLRSGRLPASVACAVGMAIVIFLGGWLNLFHLIYPGVFFALVAFGALFYLLFRKQRPEGYRWANFWLKASTWSRLLFVVAVVILLLRVAGTVRLAEFNTNDDGPAYLVFPQKMLAHHHFAYDPFSDRRVISSLGGAYFLQSFVIAATSLSHIGMADRTLGLLLLAAALFDFGISLELSAFQIALMEFIVYLVPQETINLTFVVLPISLLVTMAWLIWQSAEPENPGDFRNPILAGIVGGLIISLKSTYLPIVCAYAVIPYLAASWEKTSIKAVRFPVIVGLGSLFILLAWMIAMKTMSGTLLFPVLGSGTDYSSYGLFQSLQKFTTHRAIIKVFLQGGVLIVLICIAAVTRPKDAKTSFCIGILSASALAITAFNYKSGGDYIWRYNFPQFFVAVIVFYATTRLPVSDKPRLGASRIAVYAGVLSLIAMLFYYDVAGTHPEPFRQMFQEAKGYRASLRVGLSGSALESAPIQAEYRAVEAAIPERGVALENSEYPFLFNHKSRSIYLMDWPGAASPRPGWPFGRSPSDVAEFLKQNSIRYLVYDSGYISWEDAINCQSLERPKLYSAELYVLLWMEVLTNHQLGQVRRRYRAVYDDGTIAVIDLTSPLPFGPIAETTWSLGSDKEQVCTEVLEKYIAGHRLASEVHDGVLHR